MQLDPRRPSVIGINVLWEVSEGAKPDRAITYECKSNDYVHTEEHRSFEIV